MTTALAAQLQQLAAITGTAVDKRPRGKPSLLHTYQEAADLGLDAVYAVGLQGEVLAGQAGLVGLQCHPRQHYRCYGCCARPCLTLLFTHLTVSAAT